MDIQVMFTRTPDDGFGSVAITFGQNDRRLVMGCVGERDGAGPICWLACHL
jgi:hypothetical protein